MKPFDFDRLLVAVALALLLLTLGAARPGEAAPGNDGFIEGYAAAVLERDFGASYQYYLNDRDLKNVGAVSFGETVTLYRDRFRGVWWELGIQAGVFAVFDLDAVSKDLVNADYLVAAVVGARYGSFSAQGRLFHQSSHVGDEFLLRNRVKNRINLSYESVDLKASYDFSDAFRVYAGGGYLF